MAFHDYFQKALHDNVYDSFDCIELRPRPLWDSGV